MSRELRWDMVLRMDWWGEEEKGNVRYGINIDCDTAIVE